MVRTMRTVANENVYNPHMCMDVYINTYLFKIKIHLPNKLSNSIAIKSPKVFSLKASK